MIKNGRIRVKAIEFRLLENRECPDLGCQATQSTTNWVIRDEIGREWKILITRKNLDTRRRGAMTGRMKQYSARRSD
jgi:hypothetical protein